MRIIILFIILSVSLLSCKEDPVQSNKVPSAGNWDITFSGSASGVSLITILGSGSFSFSTTLTDFQGYEYTYTMMGVVNAGGEVTSGSVWRGSERLGDFTGRFSGVSGDGRWIGNGNGTWAASKRY